MAPLSSHQSGEFWKLLYVGDSGSGKTGSLVSLVKAGFKLRVLDLDNGLDVLSQFVRHECPDLIEQVDYITLADKRVGTAAGIITTATAYLKAVRFLNKWDDESKPSEWGADTVFVLDSLTGLGQAAYAWAEGQNSGAKDKRQHYFAAQQSVLQLIQLIMSSEFRTNVIIITHINWKEQFDDKGNLQDRKGFPSAIGSALGPEIPKYFNTILMADKLGTGKQVQRKIHTLPTAAVDLKNPAPFKIDSTYDLGTGLAEYVKQLQAAL